MKVERFAAALLFVACASPAESRPPVVVSTEPASSAAPAAPVPTEKAPPPRATETCTSEGPATDTFKSSVPLQDWPVLGGKQVGLLVTSRSPWGIMAGWVPLLHAENETVAQNAPHATYVFTFDGHSPWAVYFTSHGEGFNFLRKWSVPLPDKTKWTGDAAMQLPGGGGPWHFSAPAHLVELEVNGGKGAASNLHFVTTAARVLDGTPGYPIVPARTLDDARKRYDAWRADCGAATDRALADAGASPSGPPVGPEKEAAYEAIAPTWLVGPAQLRVLFARRIVRSSEETARKMVAHSCPPGAPCLPPREEVVTTRHGYGVELAYELTYDRTGALVATHAYGPSKVPVASLADQGIR